MKLPAPPPNLTEVMSNVSEQGAERLIKIMTAQSRIEITSMPYLPWEELKHRPPPSDFTSEEWWLVNKLSRQALQRRIPLTDIGGTNFTYALTNEALKAIEEVNRYLSGRISMAEKVANSVNRDRYLINSLMEEAITSSQLEGALTTHAVAKDMIRSGRSPISRDERMILNNYNAMRRIREIHGQPITTDLIRELQSILTDGTLDNPAAAGRFQTPDEERIVVGDHYGAIFHTPPPAEAIPDRIRRLCTFANGGPDDSYVPGVIRAIVLHFMIGYEHAFEDGNGRTARTLFYWAMLNQGFWMTEFLSISKILKKAPSQYGKSFIHTEQDESDLTYFILYQLRVIQRAIKDLNSYLERKVDEVRDFQRSLATVPGEFNHRQLALLQHAISNPHAVYTVITHGRSHDVTRQTARQDLLQLEGRGLLTRRNVGKKFTWMPAESIVEKLKG